MPCGTWHMHACTRVRHARLWFMWHDSLRSMWHELFMYVTRRVHCKTWLVHSSDMTGSLQWHDAFLCLHWLWSDWHVSFVHGTWLVHVCDKTHDIRIFVCHVTHYLYAEGRALLHTHMWVWRVISYTNVRVHIKLKQSLYWVYSVTLYSATVPIKKSWSKETPPPGGVLYLLCSLIKSRV